MIIAQITDLHIGFEGKDKPCGNTERLRDVVTSLRNLKRQPDLLLITGDLVEHGENWAYERLKVQLGQLEWPYHLALGNHDNREAFRAVFPEQPFAGEFLSYSIEDWPLRIIVLDTLSEGRHGGGFGPERQQWLDAALSEQPERPTLIALHHPPIETGIAWMSAKIDLPWVKNLEAVISKHDQIVHMVAGHIHRTIFTKFAATTVSVCPAVAPEVKLELAHIDPAKPDGRTLIADTPPSYCLHYWHNGKLTSHVASAPDGASLLKFDEKHVSVVRHTLDLSSDNEVL